jgi:cobalt-zinc-cadmium efflux system membrane fusion protein
MKLIIKNNFTTIVNIIKHFALLFIILFFFASCRSKSNKKVSEENSSEEKKSPTEVILSDEQYKSANIQLGSMELRNLTSAIKTNGRLSLPPQNKATVSTPFGGIVKEIKVATGQLVTKGTTLCIIENPDIIQLQQDYLENNSHLDFITADYSRQKTLQKDNITSQKHFQETEADYKSTVAKDNALKAKLQMLNINIDNLKNGNIIPHLTITAPISGYVQDITTNIGTFAEPNTMLFEIINNNDLHIDLQVFEKDIRKISNGQKVYFTFTNSEKISVQDTAVIFAIDKEFNSQTQSVIVHAEIQHPKGIMLPGMYVEARIMIDNDRVQSVPDEAIVSQGDEHFIFITDEKEQHTFKKIKVTVGTNDLGFTAITPTETISDDAKIVIKGAYALLSEMNKGGEEDEK